MIIRLLDLFPNLHLSWGGENFLNENFLLVIVRALSMNLLHGHATETCSMDMQHGQAARTCNTDLPVMTRSMDMSHGHPAWKSSMEKPQGHAPETYISRKTSVNYMCQSNLWRIWIILSFNIFRIRNTPPECVRKIAAVGGKGSRFCRQCAFHCRHHLL